MILTDFTNKNIPSLKPTDTVEKALDIFKSTNQKYLPVVNDRKKYFGMISKKTLNNYDKKAMINALDIKYADHFTYNHMHLLEIMKKMKGPLRVIPVLSEEGKYEGLISVKEIFDILINSYPVQAAGSIIELKMRMIDYSLAEISRLIEMNDAKILSSHVETKMNFDDEVIVTLKINTLESTRIKATFERFGYKVKAIHQSPSNLNNQAERLGLLFRYLDI